MRHLLAIAFSLGLTAAHAQAVYPPGTTQIVAAATGTTNATSATLPVVTNHVNYLCGFSIRASATAAVTGQATVTGLIGGTVSFAQFVAPIASGIGLLEETFNPCLQGNFNTAIVVSSIAPGAGGLVSVTAWGFHK